jgi:intein/homing endonuclease
MRKGQRKYKVNDNVFDIIDSEHKAYFLGLLYADGSNIIDSRGNKRIQLSLYEEDKYLVDEFSKFTDFEGPVKLYEDKPSKYKSLININSLHMSNRLSELGCGHNKTLNIKFPTLVPIELIHHFVRGYFDGDGCVGIYNRKNRSTPTATIQIVGTESFCQSLKELLNELGINSSVKNLSNTIVKCLVIGSNSGTLKFLEWLYKDATIFMKRKHNKFDIIKNLKKGTIRWQSTVM